MNTMSPKRIDPRSKFGRAVVELPPYIYMYFKIKQKASPTDGTNRWTENRHGNGIQTNTMP